MKELMSSLCDALCSEGSEVLRLILGSECSSSSMEDRICGHRREKERKDTQREVCVITPSARALLFTIFCSQSEFNSAVINHLNALSGGKEPPNVNRVH